MLVEELAKKVDADIEKRRRRDQAILWNNTFAHCHHDGVGPTLGTNREVTPRFLRPPSESEIPKTLTDACGRLPDIPPCFTFSKGDDKKKKAVGDHWDTFCGFPEATFGILEAGKAPSSSDVEKIEAESDKIALKEVFGSNFKPIGSSPDDEEDKDN